MALEGGYTSCQGMKRCGLVGAPLQTHTVANEIRETFGENIVHDIFGVRLACQYSFARQSLSAMNRRQMSGLLTVWHIYLGFGNGFNSAIRLKKTIVGFLSV